jgi:hypothetical protein
MDDCLNKTMTKERQLNRLTNDHDNQDSTEIVIYVELTVSILSVVNDAMILMVIRDTLKQSQSN